MKPLLLLVSSLLLLTGCTLPQRARPPAANTERPRAEEVNGEGQNVAITRESASGALQVAERLLPTGVLEIGNPEADHVLLVWTNHSCRYCREFQTEQLPLLLQDFVMKGDLRVQIVILPLQKYAQSQLLAGALICGAQQGKGLAMHGLLSTNPSLTQAEIFDRAATFALDSASFRPCMEDTAMPFLLDQQRVLAGSLNVTLVPTFFLDGEKDVGLPTYADLRGKIEEVIRKN